jgi:hypothetical protein
LSGSSARVASKAASWIRHARFAVVPQELQDRIVIQVNVQDDATHQSYRVLVP